MYKLTGSNSIIRLSDNTIVPFDTNSSDYKTYQLWLNEGNTPAEYILPNKYYKALSAWQVRKVLNLFNLRAQVESAVLLADSATKDAWVYSNEFERNDPVLNAMAASLGMNETQLNQLFEVGITL